MYVRVCMYMYDIDLFFLIDILIRHPCPPSGVVDYFFFEKKNIQRGV